MSVEHRREVAKRRLEQLIEQGRERAVAMAGRIHETIPRDYLVPRNTIHFDADERGVAMVAKNSIPEGGGAVGDGMSWGLHSNAMSQLQQRLRMPSRYVRDLMGEGRWGRELVAHSMSEMIGRRGKSEKLLVRSVNQEARGVLSDRYKRLDSGMILDSFVQALGGVGAVPADAAIHDTKWAVSVLVPRTFEPSPGEVVGFGATLQHSDFGNGALSFSFRIVRLICLNGMIGHNELRKVHLGQELSGAVFSERTLQYQTQTVCSALDDVVGYALSGQRIEKEITRIQKAMNTEVGNPQNVIKALQKASRITKEEEEELTTTYVNGSIEELPVGNNVWRFSQALSCLANTKKDSGKGERALELEGLAGEILDKQVGIAA